MKVVFLGTNGWYDTGTGNTVCALIKTARYDIVLDAGYGLHTLVKFRFKKGLTICAQKGGRKVLDTFVGRPFTVPLKKLPYPVKVLELPSEIKNLPFKVKTLPLVHADPVLGFRLELEGKSVTYCTDTGYCPNALELARGADLLITECAHLPGEHNPAWPHFNPETAAKLALEAGAKRLALTHFSAERYHKPALRAMALRLARRTFPRVTAARDGSQVKV